MTTNDTVFVPYPKVPRLNRPIIVTEKVDGTNATVLILDEHKGEELIASDPDHPEPLDVVHSGDEYLYVWAASRKRLIRPEDDNFGFAGWVFDNAEALAAGLGIGRHYGEWYGLGIQRGYGLNHKRFALFNPSMAEAAAATGLGTIETVPVVGEWGELSHGYVMGCVARLATGGSLLPEAEGYPAEGVMVYHTVSRQVFKVTCHNDEVPKALAEKGGAQ